MLCKKSRFHQKQVDLLDSLKLIRNIKGTSINFMT